MKRMFNSLILFLVVIFSLSACGDSDHGIDDNNNGGGNGGGITITNEGQVSANNQGIANVVVTDGKNFTVTDTDGKFSLPYNQSATHIYISSPSGYTVPVEKSVAKFYIDLKTVNDRKNINFALTKMPVQDTKHYIIAVGDPQVRNVSELNKLKPILTEMTSTIASKGFNPVHLMVAGDIVFDTPNMHDQSKEYFSAVGQPVYYTIGNHDHIITATIADANDKIADSTYIRHYGPTYYSFNRGKVHYIVLDNIFYQGGSSPVYETKITNEQLDWVKKDLSYVSKDHALVVMLHAPTLTRRGVANGNCADLHTLLKGYANVHIISGHTHYNYVVDNHVGIIEHNVGAACGGFWEGPVCLDGVNLGYKILEVDGTDIKWEYHDYTDPTAQFSVFKPDTRADILPPAEELLVNVWDWDDQWEVAYSEDGGQTFKNMIRYTELNMVYDPLAYTYFGLKGDNTVPGRTWLGATLTSHMFSAVPSPGTTQVTIRVKSRFKTYTKDVTL